jgi:4-hydroxy-3-polyprenylbenzoate decarboxylase
MDTWVVAITGASGVIFARELIRALKNARVNICLTISGPGRRVLAEELGWQLSGEADSVESQLRRYLGYSPEDTSLLYFDWQDIGCRLASGSYPTRGMVVVPCTMATLGGIANGLSSNLIERAADVTIKERRTLVLVPRETPLSPIHLRNMLALAEIGVLIVPPVPAFYFAPGSIEELVEYFVRRLLILMGLIQDPPINWE